MNHRERRLWNSLLGLLTLTLGGGLVLVSALALGWNDPSPSRPPDWQPPDLPITLRAPEDTLIVVPLGHSSGDFTMEIEAVPVSGSDLNAYGLTYRASDVTAYYAFGIGSDGYYAILRIAADEERELVEWQQFPHVRRGQQANRLRVDCAGATCHYYINDEYVTTMEDSAELVGDVGIWAHAFEAGEIAVQFNQIQVWERY